MDKSPDAFRTISEVADWLDVPTHVLRFWESRFAQVKPVKRAGGRRYYRPGDMRLIGGIKKLLHEDGMTIRGVQKLLREEGVKHVAGYSQPLEHELPDTIEGAADTGPAVAVQIDTVEETGTGNLPFLPAHDHERPATFEAESAPETLEEPSDADPAAGAEAPAEEEAAGASPDGAGLHFGSVRMREIGAADPEIPSQPDASPAELPLEPKTEDLAPQSDPVDEPVMPGAPRPPAPLLSDAPDKDPDDESPDHEAGPGACARLYMLDRSVVARDTQRLEQAVSALRAVRDRSAP